MVLIAVRSLVVVAVAVAAAMVVAMVVSGSALNAQPGHWLVLVSLIPAGAADAGGPDGVLRSV